MPPAGWKKAPAGSLEALARLADRKLAKARTHRIYLERAAGRLCAAGDGNPAVGLSHWCQAHSYYVKLFGHPDARPIPKAAWRNLGNKPHSYLYRARRMIRAAMANPTHAPIITATLEGLAVALNGDGYSDLENPLLAGRDGITETRKQQVARLRQALIGLATPPENGVTRRRPIVTPKMVLEVVIALDLLERIEPHHFPKSPDAGGQTLASGTPDPKRPGVFYMYVARTLLSTRTPKVAKVDFKRAGDGKLVPKVRKVTRLGRFATGAIAHRIRLGTIKARALVPEWLATENPTLPHPAAKKSTPQEEVEKFLGLIPGQSLKVSQTKADANRKAGKPWTDGLTREKFQEEMARVVRTSQLPKTPEPPRAYPASSIGYSIVRNVPTN